MRIRHIIRLIALLAICTSVTLTSLLASPMVHAADSQFFPATGQTVSGPFLAYWRANGGLGIFGNPISEVQTERDTVRNQTAQVQWFERARFELHPELAGTPYQVQLSLLGRQATVDREAEPPFLAIAPFSNTADATFFPQTGHGLSASFKQFWESHGALSIFGYPLSEAFSEQNPSDGKQYSVQYFERARFEYHPANPPAYQVELGLLGSQLIATALPAKQITITIAAGEAHSAITLDQTALVLSDATEMTVALQFPERIDPASFHVQLHQIPGRDAWQLAPPSRTPTLGEYVFDLQGGRDRPSYLRIDITRGTGNPAIIFGVQIIKSRSTPSLLANWNDPEGLIQSYYNAINRHEYERAYSYWENPGTPNGVTPIFADFASGYANVASVEVTTGTIASDAGAGNVVYQVPTVISAMQTDGTPQRFYGCYLLHRANVPIGDTTPPYPIALRAAHIIAASASDDPAALLQQANALVQAGQCIQ